MENPTKLSQHIELLRTRRTALTRDSVIAGISFVVTLAATTLLETIHL